jgi:hypothetical protein
MRRACVLVVLIVASAGCAGALGAVSRAGLTGRVVAGPICPVERMPPDPACAPRPLEVALRVRPVDGGRAAVTARSGADGHFRLRLAPGEYEVRALSRGGSPYPRPLRPFEVRVHAGRFTHVTITYDTGIR